MDASALRTEFPVLERVAYMNAGTDGPVPRRAAEAAHERIRHELEAGRSGKPHFEAILEIAANVREKVAVPFGCAADDIALTRSTTDGVNTVLSAIELGPGDEVLTTDEEHPGVLAPLAVARRKRGFHVRVVPFAEIANEVRPKTKLVACSHVSWIGGRMVDTEALAQADTQVLLDGAQGLGAVPVRAGELGCDWYAASGQKWLCGPDSSGYLFVRTAIDTPPWPSYGSLEDATRPLELVVHPGARRLDMGIQPGPMSAWALASLEVLEAAGWDAVHERGPGLAARLAEMLAEHGREVAPRGHSTLVAWRSEDPEAEVERLAANGVIVRHLPGRGLVRASVGAWSNEDDLERLVSASSP
jgi:selenocysteine lyase/cysteine desulfurase